MNARPKQHNLTSFMVAIRNTYEDLFGTEIDEDVLDIADDVYHGADLEDYRDELSAGQYDAIDLNMKY